MTDFVIIKIKRLCSFYIKGIVRPTLNSIFLTKCCSIMLLVITIEVAASHEYRQKV